MEVFSAHTGNTVGPALCIGEAFVSAGNQFSDTLLILNITDTPIHDFVSVSLLKGLWSPQADLLKPGDSMQGILSGMKIKYVN